MERSELSASPQWRIQTGSQGFWNPVKFPNLNENGQKSHFFFEVFLTQNPVNILSRSAIAPGPESALEVENYELKSWLKQFKLENYYPEVMETGYDDLEYIKIMTPAPEMLSDLMDECEDIFKRPQDENDVGRKNFAKYVVKSTSKGLAQRDKE